MNALKLYWTQKRQESIATITLLTTSSLILLPALWIEQPFVVIFVWFLLSSGILGHTLLMVLVHRQQHKASATFAPSGLTHLLMSLMLSMSIVQAGAQTTAPPLTTPPFEFDVTLSTGPLDNNPDNPQAIIPAAVCVGVGVGIVGWIGIKLWSACLNHQIHNLTNKPVAFQAAGDPITSPPNVPNTANPVTGSGCMCENPPTVSPLPLLLEHYDGQSWWPVSAGMIPGQQLFVPDTGTWRITPMRIIATRDSMIVPPGTLETSIDLSTWNLVSVSEATRTITPEPNHFYRIR